jgi:hypothetical protein
MNRGQQCRRKTDVPNILLMVKIERLASKKTVGKPGSAILGSREV